MKKIVIAALMASAFCGSASAQDADRFAAVEIKVEKLTDEIYVLFGAGGNIGASVGKTGVVLIDDQFAALTSKIKTALATLSDQPVKFVINTHWHGDHTGGNENLGEDGALIIAHDNVRVRMAKGAFIEAFNNTFDPAPNQALPSVTFSDKMSLHINNDVVRAHYVNNAHTDGDSLIHFEKANILHMGDTFFANRLPFIDVNSGGSIDGIIKAALTGYEISNNETVIIPGHGSISTQADLKAYHDMLVDVRGRIEALKSKGMSKDDIVATNPLDDLDQRWLQAGPEWTARFIGFVYNSL